jgi:hypothetical protein
MPQDAHAFLATSGGQLGPGPSDPIQRIAKALHFVGLAMFLGSILGHVTIGFVPGATDRAQAMLFGRQAIEVATWSLTIPGLALLALTGLFMTFRGGLGFGRRRWLTVHQIVGTLILLNAALILVPVGGNLLDAAGRVIQGSGSTEAFAALARRERVFGAANLVLALVTLFVAVLKPTLGQSRR